MTSWHFAVDTRDTDFSDSERGWRFSRSETTNTSGQKGKEEKAEDEDETKIDERKGEEGSSRSL